MPVHDESPRDTPSADFLWNGEYLTACETEVNFVSYFTQGCSFPWNLTRLSECGLTIILVSLDSRDKLLLRKKIAEISLPSKPIEPYKPWRTSASSPLCGRSTWRTHLMWSSWKQNARCASVVRVCASPPGAGIFQLSKLGLDVYYHDSTNNVYLGSRTPQGWKGIDMFSRLDTALK